MPVTVAFGTTIFNRRLLFISVFIFLRLWSFVVLLGSLSFLVGLLGHGGVAIPMLDW